MATDVETLIEDATTRTDDFKKEVDDVIDALNRDIALLKPGDLDDVFVDDPTTTLDDTPAPEKILTSENALLPAFREDIELAEPPTGLLDNLPVFQDITPIDKDSGRPVAFTKPTPTYTTPSKPTELAAMQAQPPTLNLSVAFPSAPSSFTAIAPSLGNYAMPGKPNVAVPAFTGIMPNDAPTTPGDLEAKFDASYRGASTSMVTAVNGYVDAELIKINPQYHTQMAAIETQLTTYLAGGTGLKPEIEDAIYSRARERNDAEAKRQADAVYNESAARGFTIPNGALNSQIQRLRQESANNSNKTSNEIAIAQAEMEQKNLQFAVTTSTSLRTAMVNTTMAYMGQLVAINGQAIDYAKNVLNALISVYDIAAKVFAAKLDAYKAEAAVYETRMRGAQMGVELYKAEIEGVMAQVNVDKARVDAYQATVQAYSLLTNVYKAQVDAAVSKASFEKLKVDLYQAQVQAFGETVRMKSAEWGGFQAQVEGELAKFKAFQSDVDAHRANVEAYKALIEAQSSSSRAEAATNEARSESYNAAAKAFTAHLEANKAKMEGEFRIEDNKLTGFKARVGLMTAASEENFKYYQINHGTKVENAKLKMQRILAEVENERAYRETMARVNTANLQAYGQLAAAAMSGMNTLATKSKQE